MQYPNYPQIAAVEPQAFSHPQPIQPYLMPLQPMQMAPQMAYMQQAMPQMPAYHHSYPPPYPYPPQPMGMAPQYHYSPPQPQMPLLSFDEAIRAYIDFKMSKGRDKKTIADIDQALRMLSFVRPDIQFVHHINKRLILEFETLLSDVPANYRKTPRLRNLTFETLKLAAVGKPRLSPASIDKYVITLRSFIHWCQDTDRMANWKLPKFEGLDKRNSKDKRHPFTKDELQKLFNSPLFTGHQSDRDSQLWRHKEGELVTKDHYYWVPWIALYSGMRLREIIQLEVKDIRQEGEVHYMDLNEDGVGKSLKNHASRRKVPIHGQLIEMGFLDHIEAVRARGHARIFPDAKPTAAGAPSDLFSKFFGRYLKAIGIKHSRLSFHSFRHTFIDQAARQARLPDHMIKALVGHADQTITFGTYGGRISIEELTAAVQQIDYAIGRSG